TGDEISKFVKDAGKSSAKLTAQERAAAPALDFLKRALAINPAKTAKVSVEDMSKLKVPQSVPLAKIGGDLTLPSREVIRGTSIGDILDTDTPTSKLHAFAKSISSDGKNLTLKDLLKAQRDDKRGYDSYLQCNKILERYFVGDDVKGVHKLQYKGKEMEVSSN